MPIAAAGIHFYILSFVIPAALGFIFIYLLTQRRLKVASERLREAEQLRRDIQKELQSRRKDLELQAKDEILKVRGQLEQEHREKRAELQKLERRLSQREDALANKQDSLDKRERAISIREQEINKLKEELNSIISLQRTELERISNLTPEAAKELLLKAVEEEVRPRAIQLSKEIEEQAKAEAERRAQEILATAIQRQAVEQVVSTTVAVVPLQSEDMKGRIIGREGRNIRTFEMLAGVDLIIDDTPEAVVLSSFDPIRREVARRALEWLVADGRIHPTRIEEMIAKAQKEVEKEIEEVGEQTMLELGISKLHRELIMLLGSGKFRSSYGQNLLQHSKECAKIGAIIASELGLSLEKVELVKRAALLHDIGKLTTDEKAEGAHAQVGAELARRCNEPPEVAHCIAAHHGEIEPQTIEAVIVAITDAVSASRPGARRESLETYMKRLEKLESIAKSFPGVEKAYAIQAGREVRIIVKPEEVDDLGAYQLAKDVVKKIEENLEYPGQIKVSVIRELIAVDYAK